ncbi:MAG: type II toxin-antitoxin system RelE/ParE family toxin [Bacteroidetes bacterium]|nr:MAG: type II toxin-antitoxin system RelE/ParE family toxin [Bacteroidota bacterium]
MREYGILFTRSARKELELLPAPACERILSEIGSLSRRPFPSGCTKLRGERHLWRIRIGVYRVIYSVLTDRLVIEVIRIRHRKEAYR